MRYIVYCLMICLVVVAFSSLAEASPSDTTTYVVKKGDWLSKIADQFNLNTGTLVEMNDISDPNVIHPGQELVIPEKKSQSQSYTVQKGDTLWSISQKFEVSLQNVIELNRIEDPDVIHPGQKVRIPRQAFYWKNVGVDPFTQEPENPKELKRALRLLGMSPSNALKIASEIEESEPKEAYLRKGDKLVSMVFGDSRMESPVICAFKGREPAKVYNTPTLSKFGYALVVPQACGNFALKEEVSRRRVAKEPSPEKESLPVPPRYSGPSPDGQGKGIGRDKIEAYAGGGVSEPVHGSGHNEHIWGKIRYVPYWTEAGSLDVGVGAFAYGALGSGRDGSYRHDWQRWSVGPSVKVVGDHWDADLDAGLGAIYSDGEEGEYESEQTDKIYHLSAHSSFYGRRQEGRKWFPETRLGVDVTIPYSTNHNHSFNGQSLEPDPWDNQRVKAPLRQGIYDFRPSDNSRITPEIHLGVGHSKGHDSWTGSGGMGVDIGYRGKNVLNISGPVYQHYFSKNADNWQVSLNADVANIIRLWKASRIEEVD